MHHHAAWKKIALCVAVVILSTAARAQENSDIEQRLERVEKNQEELLKQASSQKGDVVTFFRDQISLGGFFEGALTGIAGDNTNTQFSNTPDTLAINLAATFNDSLRLNSQIQFALAFPLNNPDNDPFAPSLGLPPTREFGNVTTTPTVPQIYLEYGTEPEFALQVGRGYVPYGIAFQQRDLTLFRRRGGPQMINANYPGQIAIASSIWTGVHINGSIRLSEGHWGYDVYSITPTSDPSSLGTGFRLWMEPSRTLKFGTSVQVAQRNGGPYESVGFDISYKSYPFGCDSEYANNFSAGGNGVVRTFYAEPYIMFFEGKFLIYGAADYVSNPFGETVGSTAFLSDPFEKWELGGGVNWLPYSFTRFRLGFLFNNYTGASSQIAGVDRDYYSLDISAGVEF